MGVAYHANHVVWMEVGRVELCRSLGLRYRDMEADGFLMAVVEVGCRYFAPARYDDEVAVITRVEKLGSRSMQFHYEMRLAHDNTKLAEGFSKHVFCDRTLKPVRLPDHYRQVFGRIIGDSHDRFHEAARLP